MKQGLIIVDVQNDYFAGGSLPLVGMDAAAANVQQLLTHFRSKQAPIFHIQHLSVRPGATFFIPGTPGCEIHESVTPQAGEPVVTKHFPSAFRDTRFTARGRYRAADNLRGHDPYVYRYHDPRRV